jgi:hypothetical protein
VEPAGEPAPWVRACSGRRFFQSDTCANMCVHSTLSLCCPALGKRTHAHTHNTHIQMRAAGAALCARTQARRADADASLLPPVPHTHTHTHDRTRTRLGFLTRWAAGWCVDARTSGSGPAPRSTRTPTRSGRASTTTRATSPGARYSTPAPARARCASSPSSTPPGGAP